jgi:hypothetical protein
MAMRENQGLQIALILFVMITVVLAVTTYIYFDKANKKEREAEEARKKADESDKAEMAGLAEIKLLRAQMGYKVKAEGGPATADEIAKNKAADMTLAGAKNEEHDYRTLPKHLSTQIVSLNDQLVKANARIQTLEDDLASARKQEQTNTSKYIAQHDDAAAELAKMTVEYRTRREELVTQVDKSASDLAERGKEIAKTKADKDKEIDALAQRVNKLDLLRKTLTDKIDATQQRGSGSEKPDGKVTWVSQRGGMVYLNLGSDDGLQRSTMFTVYDAGVTSIAQAEPKASVEVTTVRGPHLAEARIVEDSLSNPILSQDVVYSPVWNPGQKTHFALVGFMDIDADGKSDRALIRSLIRQNGGEVDAEVLDDGNRQGKLTTNTRFLVAGAAASDKTSEALRDASSTMIGEAKDLGVETISVERLLSDMGWRGSERTVTMGRGAAGGDFKPEPKETPESGLPKTSGAGGFKPRTRPGSAY